MADEQTATAVLFNKDVSSFVTETLSSERSQYFLTAVARFLHEVREGAPSATKSDDTDCTFCTFLYQQTNDFNEASRRFHLEYARQFGARMPMTMGGVCLTWFYVHRAFSVPLEDTYSIDQEDSACLEER